MCMCVCAYENIWVYICVRVCSLDYKMFSKNIHCLASFPPSFHSYKCIGLAWLDWLAGWLAWWARRTERGGQVTLRRRRRIEPLKRTHTHTPTHTHRSFIHLHTDRHTHTHIDAYANAFPSTQSITIIHSHEYDLATLSWEIYSINQSINWFVKWAELLSHKSTSAASQSDGK